MMKRLLALAVCAVMLLSLIPAAALTASAAVEGDWTTFRFANEYCDNCGESCEHEREENFYRPAPGYRYTSEGFTVIPSDYTDRTPAMTVVTKDAQAVKDGIYLQFRVDDFSYDGGQDADEWIALTLNTEQKVWPGSTQYGGGWMTLIRGKGDGAGENQVFLTEPATDTSPGSFALVGTHDVAVSLDDQGREIYTLEITWDGSAYEMKLNGQVIPGGAEATALLEKLNPDGEFFVGIHMQAGVKDGTAALTVLKYGTTEANATTPVGDDYKEAEETIACGIPEADPDAVPINQPAILWSPETVETKEGHNCTFTVLGDNTWRIQATDADIFLNFTPKRTWSYKAEDFPVFGILLHDFRLDSGTLWYSAGDVTGPTDNCTVPFSVYEGVFYGEDEEYIFVPVDLTDLWEGRINNIRLDFYLNEDNREFDICFAGMFRSREEAYAYAEGWLGPVCTLGTEVSDETNCIGAPPSDPETEIDVPAWIPEEAVTEVVSAVEDALDTEAGETVPLGDVMEDILAQYGCSGTLGGGMLLALAAAALVLRKRA